MIDICDLAVGLSRQLFGLTIASERPGHRMMEQWHPLGVVGVISAFNFPVAVWSWNAALALVCGDAVVWKPSEKTVLTALACQALRGRGRAPGRGARRGLVSRPRRTGGRARHSIDDPRVALRERDRLDPDGPGGRAAGGRAVRSAAARAGREQRGDRGDRRPTWIWPCAASSSRPPAPPGSAARHCAASSPTRRSPTIWSRASRRLTRRLPIGSPLADGHAGRPADRRGRVRGLPTRAREGGGRRRRGRRSAASGWWPTMTPDAYYVQPAARADAGADRGRAGRDLRADPLRA